MKKAFLILFTIAIVSCSNSEVYDKIYGEWECASWISKSGNKDKCNNNVSFKFNDDKTYNSQLGKVEDSGKFKIMSNKLHVYPDGKMEIAVEIEKITSDTLIFLMNMAGVEETLTLTKR